MSLKELQLLDYFEPQNQEAWQDVARTTLKGKPLEKLKTSRWEGFETEALYTHFELPEYLQNPPNTMPFARGSRAFQKRDTGWEMRATYSGTKLDDILLSLQNNQELHVHSHGFTLESYGAAGHQLPLYTVQDLKRILSAVDGTAVPFFFDVGANALSFLGVWTQALHELGIEPSSIVGGLLADPLGHWARSGHLPNTLERIWADSIQSAQWLKDHAPEQHAWVFSGLPYHDAGANGIQEIASIAATLVETLRALDPHTLSLEDVLSKASIRVGIGRDMFAEIAKLRALRIVVSKVLTSCGVDAELQQLPIHACTSRVTATGKDHWVNLLRGTAECFSAVVGGAHAITLTPFDSTLGSPSTLAQRQAITTQLILAQEAHIGRVVDPAGGAWFIEELTEKMARAAWSYFQEIERAGGWVQSLRSGRIADDIKELVQRKKTAISKRKEAIVGVSEYPNPADPIVSPVETHASAPSESGCSIEIQENFEATLQAIQKAAQSGHSYLELAQALHADGEVQSCQALPVFRWSAEWEQLRHRSDTHTQENGRRPSVFLVNLGGIPQHKARASFAQRFFEAGGFTVHSTDGFTPTDVQSIRDAYQASQADGYIFCGQDESYIEHLSTLLDALSEESSAFVALAGRAGEHAEAWKQKGLTHEIYLGCNGIAALKEMQHAAGVCQ